MRQGMVSETGYSVISDVGLVGVYVNQVFLLLRELSFMLPLVWLLGCRGE